MRNYVLSLFQQVLLHGDDGMGGSIDITATAAGGDAAGLATNIGAAIKFAEETNDPTHIYTWTQTPQPVAPVYWLFDKTNVINFANYLADFLYLSVVTLGTIPQMGIAKLGTDLKPRKGWKDEAGVLRKPSPTDLRARQGEFSGAAGLLAFVNHLPAYAELLQAEGRTRDAGLVRYAYRRIIDGTFSITDALQFLRDNFL